MKIGDIVTKAQYTATAIWCNQNNCHIERQDGQYVIVANEVVDIPVTTEPTLEDRVATLESENETLKADNETLNDTLLGIIEILDGGE